MVDLRKFKLFLRLNFTHFLKNLLFDLFQYVYVMKMIKVKGPHPQTLMMILNLTNVTYTHMISGR